MILLLLTFLATRDAFEVNQKIAEMKKSAKKNVEQQYSNDAVAVIDE